MLFRSRLYTRRRRQSSLDLSVGVWLSTPTFYISSLPTSPSEVPTAHGCLSGGLCRRPDELPRLIRNSAVGPLESSACHLTAIPPSSLHRSCNSSGWQNTFCSGTSTRRAHKERTYLDSHSRIKIGIQVMGTMQSLMIHALSLHACPRSSILLLSSPSDIR